VKQRPPGWHPPAALALWATALMLGAWAVLGMRLEGWFPWTHPFALPGARGVPGADVFNALVFVLPGALMAVAADSLRRRLPNTAGWRPRIGCALALLAALGWMGQGLWPLEPELMNRLDAGGSHWHALALTVWWMAAASAALLMALAVPRLRGWSGALTAVLFLPGLLPVGPAVTIWVQPAAALVWGGWCRAALRAWPIVLTTPATTRSR